MKNADNLKARLGAHMAESMGDATTGAGALPAGFAAPSGRYAGCTRIKDALSIELERITPPPAHPRREWGGGPPDAPAASLRERGQLQPARVRWDDSREKWVIIAGERRYRAAIKAGLKTL